MAMSTKLEIQDWKYGLSCGKTKGNLMYFLRGFLHVKKTKKNPPSYY